MHIYKYICIHMVFSLLVLVISVTIIVCLGVYICKVCTLSMSSCHFFNTKRVAQIEGVFWSKMILQSFSTPNGHYKLLEFVGPNYLPPSLFLQLFFFNWDFVDLVEVIVAHTYPVYLVAHISLVYLVANIDPVHLVATVDPIIPSAQAPVQVDTIQDKRSHITGSNNSCQLSSTVCEASKPGKKHICYFTNNPLVHNL